MAELIVALVGAGAALLVWRALRARVAVSSFDGHVPSHFGVMAQPPVPDVHQWPRLGRFDFSVAETAHAAHQDVLRQTLEQHGAYCMATLVPHGDGGDPGAPVAVHLDAQRVGFLSMGDATRFHRRLAYEGCAGQPSHCGAQISGTEQGRRSRSLTIQLDLKPFRH